MSFEEEFKIISDSHIVKELIELGYVESANELTFSEYLILWLLIKEKQTSLEERKNKLESQDDSIEVNEEVTVQDNLKIKKQLEDNGFVLLEVFFEIDTLYITVKSKTGRIYKIKLFLNGGVRMDDFDAGDFSDNESTSEISTETEASDESIDANTELVDSEETVDENIDVNDELVEEETKENGGSDDITSELVEDDETAKSTIVSDGKDEEGELENVDEDEELENIDTDEDEELENIDTNEKVSSVSTEVRAEINEKSNYSPEVNAYINSVEELEIYQKAGLEEVQINGRTCLIRSDIDLEQEVDEFGMTNADLIREGYAPFDKDGHKIELHHIGQKEDAPLAELTYTEHHSPKNYSILHDANKESEINRTTFSNVRFTHWKSRL